MIHLVLKYIPHYDLPLGKTIIMRLIIKCVSLQSRLRKVASIHRIDISGIDAMILTELTSLKALKMDMFSTDLGQL